MDSPTEHTPPLLTLDGARATVLLNRPREHNRIDPADLPVLVEHFARVEADPAIRVLVITGAGEKTFSSGYTLAAVQGLDRDAVTFDVMVDRLEELAVPTVCALNGSVYGGATDVALACDFRIGIGGTRFLMPASRIGLHYYPGGMRRYVEQLGSNAAKRMFLLGEPTPAEDLAKLGFFHALVERRAFESTVEQVVTQLTAGAPAVMRSMKRHCNLIARGEYHPAQIQAAYETSLRSLDLQEGLVAMNKKRAPRFVGR